LSRSVAGASAPHADLLLMKTRGQFKLWHAGLLVAAGLAGVLAWRLGQSEKPNVPPATEALRSELALVNGRLCQAPAGPPFSGALIERYPDGLLRSRSRLVDGLLTGVSEGWHTNGQLAVREHFVAGVSHGPRIQWYASGSTQSIAEIARGQHDGLFQRWREDGTLAERVQMRDGQPDGVSLAFYPSGCVKARVLLRAGQVREQQFWPEGEQRAGALVSMNQP